MENNSSAGDKTRLIQEAMRRRFKEDVPAIPERCRIPQLGRRLQCLR